MKTILSALLLTAATLAVQAQDATFSYFSYEGNDARFSQTFDPSEAYLNPILAGFYPDPAVCRKGDTYYLVNSSFSFFPGVPLFESTDLVNWRQTGHVLDRESQLQLQGQWVSGGIYAPAISYNEANNTFYMITTNVGKGGNFYVKTTDPRSSWSDPVYLPKVDGIDPSFLFDRDGRAYIVHNAPVMGEPAYDGQRAIRLLEFSVAGDSIIGEPIEIVRGGTHLTDRPIWIEGPHLYHIGKYYYLMCAEGGTGDGHSEVIFRAKSPKGPWEECPHNPILTQRDLSGGRPDAVTSTGHADLIEAKDGSWWAVFLGCRPYEGDLYNTGRETFLLPVTWKDGWPLILPKGEAVPTVVKKKGLGKKEDALSGNFSYTDRFSASSLHPRWLFLRNPRKQAYELSANGLTLHSSTGKLSTAKALNALFTRQQHTTFTAETALTFTPTTGHSVSGLTLFQNEQHHFLLGKTLLGGRPAVVLRRVEQSEVMIASAPLLHDGPLRLKVEADGRYCSFFYAEGEAADWRPLAVGVDAANLSTARAGGFIGAMIGLVNQR